MSYAVLHMDKFKKDAVRGIQSHNLRERKSHSNPDIDTQRSGENYELLAGASGDYARAIQSRIDDLLLTKAVRHDAVRMCGLIVSSDSEFFMKLSPEETRRFFEESKSFLSDFVGKENVISAMVHMDEKTPHMHFLHVPVNKEGRLNANSIYTRDSLKILQTEFHRHLHSKGFAIQRGVEQEPGAKKKHLDTREFKQQQEAVNSLSAEVAALEKEAHALAGKIEIGQQQEASLQQRVQAYETQATEAEKILQEDADIPEVSVFNFKPALEKARSIITAQKQALTSKQILADRAKYFEGETKALQSKVKALEAEKQQHEQQAASTFNTLKAQIHKLKNELNEYYPFLSQTNIFWQYSMFRSEQARMEREAEDRRHQEAVERQQAEERERASQVSQPSAYRAMRPGR